MVLQFTCSFFTSLEIGPNKQNDSSIVVAPLRKEEVIKFPIVGRFGDFDHRIGASKLLRYYFPF